MSHDTPLISTLAIGLVLAFAFGILATRLRLPPIAGYLLAGVAAGPFTPGFVADPELSKELTEIGVILLMFGVGLHFSIKDLLAVKRIAIPGAIVQIAAATLMGMGVSHFLGWGWVAAWCSGCRCRWPVPWCCCGPWKNARWWKADVVASPWAG